MAKHSFGAVSHSTRGSDVAQDPSRQLDQRRTVDVGRQPGRTAAQGAQLAPVAREDEGGQGGDPTLVRACDCRKPRPGMLTALLARLGADASRSWMIGDGAGDVEAGRAAGVKTAL
ncbi:MAG TPA: HAD hydrolase-like protein, partial [Polyangiaceae bacterium]